MKNILVTGGAGFIGSNFIRRAFFEKGFSSCIVNLDKLTYAGNPMNLCDVAAKYEGKRYFFVKGDICDHSVVTEIFKRHEIDTVVNFAAESHVDRSILGPADFMRTNIFGTFNLLEVAREHWQTADNRRFHHISTDEIFGSSDDGIPFTEKAAYDPSSPYSASKAGSDHLVRAYFKTYGLPVTITNCSNNYGPYQFPEKLIPLMIINAMEGKPLPVYGDGKNVRDWLHVIDHCDGIWQVLTKGRPGETYNIGGNSLRENVQVVRTICDTIERMRSLGSFAGSMPDRGYQSLISFVTDRPGHDRCYMIDSSKIERELGWTPKKRFEDGLEETVEWYLNNCEWVRSVRTGEYRNWIERNYSAR